MPTDAATHAGTTLRGVAPEEIVDRRPIAYLNTAQSRLWRGDDPAGWLVERVGELVGQGVRRVGLHQPGLPEDWAGGNPLNHIDRLTPEQTDALNRAAERFAGEVEWCVNLGGTLGYVVPLMGWGPEIDFYGPRAAAEFIGWATLLGRGGRFVAFLDGMGTPNHFITAARSIIRGNHLGKVTVGGRQAIRLGTYVPDYSGPGGRSKPDTHGSARVRLTTLRHVKGAVERGRLDLDHLDFLLGEQHLWLTGHQERRERADGNRGYREIDDPLVAEWADRGGIVSSMTADPEVLAVCRAMTERGAAAAIKLLEQREREEMAEKTLSDFDPVAEHVEGIEMALSDADAIADAIAADPGPVMVMGAVQAAKAEKAAKVAVERKDVVRRFELSLTISPEAARDLIDKGGTLRVRGEGAGDE